MLALAVAAACGGTQKHDPQPPVPPTDSAAKIEGGPVDHTLVRLVSPGDGARAQLRVSPKVGAKQAIELAIDISQSTRVGGTHPVEQKDTVPTVVLSGTAEVKTVDAHGAAYQLVVTTVDVRGESASMSADKLATFRTALGALKGMTIDSTIAPNGAAGELKLHLDSADQGTRELMSVFQVALPAWPVLPNEPIGVGAKWQVVAPAKLLEDKLDVIETTDYELVKHEGATWTIRGTTRVTGTDQSAGGAQVSNITGTGSIEVALVDGVLYPTTKASIATEFLATMGDATSGTVAISRTTQFTPK